MTDFALRIYQDAVAYHVTAAARCREVAADVAVLGEDMATVALQRAAQHDREVDFNAAAVTREQARIACS